MQVRSPIQVDIVEPQRWLLLVGPLHEPMHDVAQAKRPREVGRLNLSANRSDD